MTGNSFAYILANGAMSSMSLLCLPLTYVAFLPIIYKINAYKNSPAAILVSLSVEF
jgi:hypothetical protein